MRLSQIAINSVSTRHSHLEEALDAYAAAGFRKVEFALPQAKEWLSGGRGASDLKGALESRGLRCIGGFEAHLGCFGSADSMRANLELHLANARLLHELGGGTLVVGTDGPPQPSMEALDTVAERIAELASRAEGLDVTFALEFNWSPLVRSLKSAYAVVRKANHPRVGILFDPAHYYCTTTKLDHLNAETVPWIRHLHFNDMRDKPAELSNCNSDRVLPGEGILELPAILERLERHGYQGDYSIEMFNEDLWSKPAAEAAALCYRAMQPYCKG